MESDPLHAVELRELRLAVRKACEQLPERQQFVVECDFELFYPRMPDKVLARLCNTSVAGLAEIREHAMRNLRRTKCLMILAGVAPDSCSRAAMEFTLQHIEQKAEGHKWKSSTTELSLCV